ncbi:potassium/sodium hyperpolarization-activated cyclic nucleotide-gated channel 2 [Manduca sexta]|uniref:potassium/sodium hyperpolarization-activated cyclic nucleotide-gated channel 2 n=1 Tax=Manduca sexta TaxID=7130 RepID=UPI001183F5C0|nr:potassium/sodium hyperpolarization-activated cyclic nucleotide-gated channel 2 [Manduca sexta]XP_030041053.1 potassium/sodium hyperpolarization-activated cyclic nucleotide-gated channel 2 [Manduca sexta]
MDSDKTENTKTEKKTEEKVNVMISRGYFQGHQCNLSNEKLTPFKFKCNKLRKLYLDVTTVDADDIRAQKMYRSYAALCAEKYRQYMFFPFSVHPYSKLRFWLEAVFVFFMLSSNALVAVHYSETVPDDEDLHDCMMMILDIMYILNVLFNFFTGYVEGVSCKHTVLDLKKIARKYTSTWFLVDLMSSVCFLPSLLDMKNVTPHLILVSMKVLRMPILIMYLNNVLTVMKIEIFKKSVIEIFAFIISYLSWNIYYQFATEYIIEGTFAPISPRACSWISIGKLWNATSTTRFIFAFDRAVGLLRKNSNLNLLKQDGCFEDFFVVSWLIAKLLVFHCALKYVVSLFGFESARSRYYIMTKQIENYMNQRKFPPRIKSKILKFYAIRFQSNFFVESRLLACVSGQLRQDIIMHAGRQLVSELEFLKQLPRALLLQIGLKLRIVIFITGDIIFKINTVGDCLYFIDRGTVAIYSESGKEICHLEDGDFFGEIALVMKHHFRTASAVAVTNCELFRLDREDFDSSIACYPTVYEDIKKVATNRYERTCVLDEHHKTEIKIGQERKMRE